MSKSPNNSQDVGHLQFDQSLKRQNNDHVRQSSSSSSSSSSSTLSTTEVSFISTDEEVVEKKFNSANTPYHINEHNETYTDFSNNSQNNNQVIDDQLTDKSSCDVVAYRPYDFDEHVAEYIDINSANNETYTDFSNNSQNNNQIMDDVVVANQFNRCVDSIEQKINMKNQMNLANILYEKNIIAKLLSQKSARYFKILFVGGQLNGGIMVDKLIQVFKKACLIESINQIYFEENIF